MTWRTAYPTEIFTELREFRKRLGGKSTFLFPRLDDRDGPTRAELLSQWIAKAEAEAGLPKLQGSLCHAYRRKWKSDRAHHPIKAVADAGGWKDIGTMLKCYEISDDAAILEVTSSPRYRLAVAAPGESATEQPMLAAG